MAEQYEECTKHNLFLQPEELGKLSEETSYTVLSYIFGIAIPTVCVVVHHFVKAVCDKIFRQAV
ncbi:hypothetical protein HK096_001764, partial [Nowakowskiella sp. JEL0078]